MIDDVYQVALATLQHHLDEAGASYTLDEGEFLLQGHRLALSITFEGCVAQGEHTLAPLDIQIHLDGDTGDRFRVGTLGVGNDAAGAVRQAVAEWHLLAAAPLLAALGAPIENRRAAKAVRLADWDLFAGRVGIRGQVPPELRGGGSFYRSLIEGFHKVVSKWEEPKRFQLRSLYFMATCSADGTEVQAAVDGLVNEELGEVVAALPWPAAVDAYLYKQLFVLRSGG